MSEWKDYRLGELYEVHNGLSKGGKFFGSGYPFLTFSTVFKNYFIPNKLNALVQTSDKERTSCNILEGDIFVTRTSETAEELGMSCVALHDYPDATYNGFTKRLRKKESCDIDVDSLYIGYYLRSKRFRSLFYGIAGGMSTRASLANNDLLNMVVCLPTIQEQIKIGQFLFNIDSKIECNRKICANLEAQAQALFKHWFIDFAPFKEGKFVESELGMIPEGWRVGRLEEIAEIVKPSVKPKDGIVYSHYSIPAFDNGEKPSNDNGETIKSNKFAIKDCVTMLSKLNPDHKRIWFVDKVENNAVCSTEFLPFYAKNSEQSYFVYCYLNCMQNYREIANGAKGTTNSHQRIDANAILSRTLAYNTNAITKFCNIIEEILKQKNHAIQESSRLSTLRDTLLPKLMSGQIKL